MEKHWIQTYSGKRVCPLCMSPDDVCIEDIAHSLSLINRFTGHTSEPYSVAQHSLIVSRLCSRENDMWGLLHDATEAYITDLSRPLKLCILERYGSFMKEIERSVMDVICVKFGLQLQEPDEVKIADNQALAHEAWSFFGETENYKHWKAYNPNAKRDFVDPIVPMDWRTAQTLFVMKFKNIERGT